MPLPDWINKRLGSRSLSDSPTLTVPDEQSENTKIVQWFLLKWGMLTLSCIILFSLYTNTPQAPGKSHYFGSVLATIGHGLMITAGMASIGGFVGFLFGIPNVDDLPRTPIPALTPNGTKPALVPDEVDDGYRQSVNSNISTISDWLTKTLVGLGLTQIGKAPALFLGLADRFHEGLAGSQSFALALVINSLIMGFMTGYLETRLFLSVAFYLADTAVNRRKRTFIRSLRDLFTTKVSETVEGEALIDEKQPALEGMREIARKFVNQSMQIGVSLRPLELLKDSKVLYLAGDYEGSEQALKKAESLDPSNPEILFYHAYAITKQGKQERMAEAALILERLVTLPMAKPAAWKLLGYVYLFIPGKDLESEKATQTYLNRFPEDAGALLNRACALGQRGPGDSKREEETVELVKKAIAKNSAYKSVVKDLTHGDGDFVKWTSVKAFQELLN